MKETAFRKSRCTQEVLVLRLADWQRHLGHQLTDNLDGGHDKTIDVVTSRTRHRPHSKLVKHLSRSHERLRTDLKT